MKKLRGKISVFEIKIRPQALMEKSPDVHVRVCLHGINMMTNRALHVQHVYIGSAYVWVSMF